MGKNSRLLHLDGLRGLLAVSVASSHIYGSLTSYAPGRPFEGAYLAVDYFFLLSGFVLTYFLRKDTVSYSGFFLRRLMRLWPLHALAFLICVIVYSYNAKYGYYVPQNATLDIKTAIHNLSFLSSSGMSSVAMINDPAWSISVEFWVSALLLYGLVRVQWPFRMMLSLTIYCLFLIKGVGLEVSDQPFSFVTYGILKGIAGISVGSAMFDGNSFFRDFMEKRSALELDFGLGLCLGIVFAGLYGHFGSKFDFVFLIVFLPFLASTFDQRTDSKVISILSSPALVWLGTISFALYLLHTPLIVLFAPGNHIGTFGFWLTGIVTLVISVIFAAVVNFTFSIWSQRLTKELIGRGKAWLKNHNS